MPRQPRTLLVGVRGSDVVRHQIRASTRVQVGLHEPVAGGGGGSRRGVRQGQHRGRDGDGVRLLHVDGVGGGHLGHRLEVGQVLEVERHGTVGDIQSDHGGVDAHQLLEDVLQVAILVGARDLSQTIFETFQSGARSGHKLAVIIAAQELVEGLHGLRHIGEEARDVCQELGVHLGERHLHALRHVLSGVGRSSLGEHIGVIHAVVLQLHVGHQGGGHNLAHDISVGGSVLLQDKGEGYNTSCHFLLCLIARQDLLDTLYHTSPLFIVRIYPAAAVALFLYLLDTMKSLRRRPPSNEQCTNVCKEECEFLLNLVHKLVELSEFVRPKVVTSAMIYKQEAKAVAKVTPLGFAKFLFRQKFPEECVPDDMIEVLYRVGMIREYPPDYIPNPMYMW
jgi:hypothetical protein